MNWGWGGEVACLSIGCFLSPKTTPNSRKVKLEGIFLLLTSVFPVISVQYMVGTQ